VVTEISYVSSDGTHAGELRVWKDIDQNPKPIFKTNPQTSSLITMTLNIIMGQNYKYC